MGESTRDTNSGVIAIRTPTVLVVDGDRVSRRFVELALNGLIVESANDAAAAMEVLHQQVVDLIVSDTMLPDTNGLRFFRQLREETRLRTIPFVFLSSDTRVDTKIVAFRAGVDDYIVKPCDSGELGARVLAIVGRARRSRREHWNRTYTLAGDFSAMSFPDLVASIDMGHRTGVLSVLSADVGGQVFFEDGRAVHALYGNLTGAEAFYHFVWQPEGQFEFTAGPIDVPPKERTLSGSATGLIMEAARLADDAAQRGEDAPRLRWSLPGAHRSSFDPSAPRVAGPAPDATLAAQYEMAIRDPYSLGNLKILNETHLSKWTASTVGRDRVHIVLVASLAEAISAMLPLAGAPTEQSIIDSLEPGRKALALAFFLRDERLLDIVLLDAKDPSVFLPSLRRIPSVMMIAPPHGDIMAFGTQTCAVLERMVDTLNPVAVMGVGLPTLEEGLQRMGIQSTSCRVVRCLPAPLGDPSYDSRLLLVHALRLWTVGSKARGLEQANGSER